MATPKTKNGKKVSKNVKGVDVSFGLKKAPAQKGEVSGHMSPGAYYNCWNDGAVNFVPYGWTYFICRVCGAFNRC
jgi:hypothetical protein